MCDETARLRTTNARRSGKKIKGPFKRLQPRARAQRGAEYQTARARSESRESQAATAGDSHIGDRFSRSGTIVVSPTCRTPGETDCEGSRPARGEKNGKQSTERERAGCVVVSNHEFLVCDRSRLIVRQGCKHQLAILVGRDRWSRKDRRARWSRMKEWKHRHEPDSGLWWSDLPRPLAARKRQYASTA